MKDNFMLTISAHESLNQMPKAKKQKALDFALSIKKQYLKKLTKMPAWAIAAMAQTQVSSFEIKFDKISCKKGCSFCCYINVDITKEEAILLIKVYKESNIKLDINYLKNQQFDRNKIPYNERACIFLNKKDGSCLVYENRPLACRKYQVMNDPDKCNTEKYSALRTIVVANHEMEFFVSGVYNASPPDSMEKMLLKEIERG